MTKQSTFVDVIHPVRNDPDLTVHSIPLLGEEDDIDIEMAVLQEVGQTIFGEGLVIAGIGEERSLINADQSVMKVIHADTLIVDVCNAGDGVMDVAVDMIITLCLCGLLHELAHDGGLSGTGQTEI